MRTDVARRRRSSQWVAISFSSILPAKKGSSVGHRPAGTKAWSLRSERFGMHRGEAEPEQVAEREHMIRDAAAVGVMDGDVDVAAVIQKPVDDVRGLAFGRGDDLRVEGGVAARDEGVERDGRKRTFVRTDRSGDLAPSPEREMLAVRARYVGGVEGGRQGLGMLRGHHPRQGRVAEVVEIRERRNLRVT
jgi:hypothetical protein